MLDLEVSDRFELLAVTDREWVVYDRRYTRDDARCVVACIRATDADDVEVVWLDGRAFPVHYSSVEAVLDDLIVATLRGAHGAGGARPVEIPHLPPRRLVG